MKHYDTVFLTFLFACTLVMVGCEEQPDTADDGMATDTAEQEGMGGMDSDMAEREGMGGMSMGEGYVPDSLSVAKLAPLVKGYYDGEEVYFIHTEVSDPQVGAMLTEMMGPEVVVVPGLAQAPDALRAEIYVFENGVEGQGPFGYQPDVFGSVPGEADYSPLVSIQLVTWNEGATPRELRSESEVQNSADQGEITIKNSGTIVNAPVLAWPGKTR